MSTVLYASTSTKFRKFTIPDGLPVKFFKYEM